MALGWRQPAVPGEPSRVAANPREASQIPEGTQAEEPSGGGSFARTSRGPDRGVWRRVARVLVTPRVRGRQTMDYAKAFAQALLALKAEGRYRVFADIRRDCGSFPTAQHFTVDRSKP